MLAGRVMKFQPSSLRKDFFNPAPVTWCPGSVCFNPLLYEGTSTTSVGARPIVTATGFNPLLYEGTSATRRPPGQVVRDGRFNPLLYEGTSAMTPGCSPSGTPARFQPSSLRGDFCNYSIFDSGEHDTDVSTLFSTRGLLQLNKSTPVPLATPRFNPLLYEGTSATS